MLYYYQERAPDEQKEEHKKLKVIMERHKTLIPRVQVSCDWWRAGHVTTVLTSDWCRRRWSSPSATGTVTAMVTT